VAKTKVPTSIAPPEKEKRRKRERRIDEEDKREKRKKRSREEEEKISTIFISMVIIEDRIGNERFRTRTSVETNTTLSFSHHNQ
jgi:hypothetical protein